MRHNKSLYKGRSGPVVCTSTTRPANPYIGMEILETDTGNILYFYGGTAQWCPPWNVSWGQVGKVEVTADVSFTSTTPSDLASLNFNAFKNRRYRYMTFIPVMIPVGSAWRCELMDGSNAIINGYAGRQAANAVQTGPWVYIFNEDYILANANITRKSRFTGGTASTSTIALAGSKALWIAEDMGPVGAPQ